MPDLTARLLVLVAQLKGEPTAAPASAGAPEKAAVPRHSQLSVGPAPLPTFRLDPGPGAASRWPARLPWMGAKRVVAYTACQDCVDRGGRPVEESVRLSFMDEIARWRVELVEGTFAAYGERALCLAHARQRLHAEMVRRIEGFGSDVDWELGG